MNALIMLVLGAGVGAGVLLVLHALRPATVPVRQVFDAVELPGIGFNEVRPSDRDHPVRRLLVGAGKATIGLGDQSALRRDLAVTGSTLEDHAMIKAGAPAVAVLGCYLTWLVSQLLGLGISPLWATLGALCAAGAAFVVPDARLRARAKARRVGFRHALSAYLDLVTVIMSGGGGLLTALQSAADAGDGWAFAEIRAALDRARLSNRTPWSQLGVLGERFDIPELQDLVAAAELAGSEGARISESIATKSDVLRSRLQAEVEQTAESLTEQMLLPVGLVLVALFLFLGFAVFEQFGQSSTPFTISFMAATP